MSIASLHRAIQAKMARTRERDLRLAPFLREHRLRGTGWLGEQLGLNPKHVAKIMKRLGIPRRPKTGPPADRSPFWRGGRIVDKDGYILVLAHDHPRANRHGYVREHRLVVEKTIGRYLTPDEVVHHRNGVKDDNRPENLELHPHNGTHMVQEWTGRKHTPETRAKMRESALRRSERQRSARQVVANQKA